MNNERLNQIYRDEGWGELAERAGFNPVDTESGARMAFRYCAEQIAEKDRIIKDLLDNAVYDEERDDKCIAAVAAARATLS